ncbi:MAG: carbohydrate-binding domain-containing protein [Mogibacterium sp.]|nr:carbohydrate-binding domain-containing protein [Mogibacterium sp.]
MNSNKDTDYRNRTYEDAGVDIAFARKALISMIALLLALVITLTGCGASAGTASGGDGSAAIVATEAAETSGASKADQFTERDLSGEYDKSEAETITLSRSSAKTSASSGVTIDGSTVTITEEGVYIVSGSLSDGQIVVDADESAKVQIVLNNVSVTSSDSAALYVKSADKVFVTLADGTKNTLANGGSFVADGDTNVDGAIFAKDDITINGSGSLTVSSPAGHGIVGKDDVKIAGGNIIIEAAKHGVQANDSVRVAEADINITAGTDGIHVSDDADEEEGTESDSYFYIADGSVTISAGDDGIHADAQAIIEGGTVTVTESYEGIEALDIDIIGGKVDVTASDDGINAAGGSTSNGSDTSTDTFGSDDWFGGKGGGFNDGGSNGSIDISGGAVSVKAGGDGIDANGSITVSGGYTVVTGPTQGDTSVLDYNSTATITGGTFIGTGGAGMAVNFTSAEQGLIAVSTGNQSAGSSVKLTDESGAEIAEIEPELDYAVVYISTADMTQGSTYTLTAGSYSESITLSDMIYSNLTGGMNGGGLGGGGPRGGMNDGTEMNGGGMPEGMEEGAGRGGMRGGHGGGMRQEAGSGSQAGDPAQSLTNENA